jgi:hypothetical protein
VSSVAGSSLGVMGKTAAKSLAINLAIGGGSSFVSNVATNHIAEKFNLNKTETTLLNIGMHIGLVYGARGVVKILKGKLFGKQDSVNIEDNGGHEAKIPRTGSEWNEYFKSKYGSENVEWHSKLTEGGVNTEANLLSKSGQIPLTGVERFDRLAYGTDEFNSWKANLEACNYKVVENYNLPPGNPANVLKNGTIEVNPNEFRYIDLLHESRHIFHDSISLNQKGKSVLKQKGWLGRDLSPM